MQVRPVYIVEAVRTPQTTKSKPAKPWWMPWTSKPGKLANVRSIDLGVTVVDALVLRSELKNREAIDEVFGSIVTPVGEGGGFWAKDVATLALSSNVPASLIKYECGSSLFGAREGGWSIAVGDNNLVVAFGAESMSRVPMGSDWLPPPTSKGNIFTVVRKGEKAAKTTRHPKVKFTPMGVSGGLIADEWKYTAREMNQYVIDSHKKAKIAQEEGRFSLEIVPVETGKDSVVDKDDGIRISDHATLARLPAKWGRITAAQASLESDGASALLLASEDALDKYNLTPRARIVASAVSANVKGAPELQLTATIDAVEKVLKKANLTVNDIDLFEINEAFVPVVLATLEDTDIPYNKTNVNGGALALGHPFGASGARLITTLLHELERQNLKRGLAVLCVGGGQAIAMIIER